jgi:hypothetical protein
MTRQDATHGQSASDSVREDAFMFRGKLSIEAVFVRLLQAYLALIILDSSAQGITVGSVVLAMLVVAIIEAAFSTIRRRVRQAVADGKLHPAEDFPRILADALKRAKPR